MAQHVLGLVCAWLLYDAARRAGAGRWWALVPAAVLSLSLDQIVTEHTLKTDALFGFLLAAALWALVRGYTGRRPLFWCLGAGAALGAAALVRLVGAPLLPVSVVAVLAVLEGRDRPPAGPRGRPRGRRAGAHRAVRAGLARPGGPLESHGDRGLVVVRARGPVRGLHAIRPPAETANLCEDSDPDDRPGPDYYAWGGGPAREIYGHFLNGNAELRAFARAVPPRPAARLPPRGHVGPRPVFRTVAGPGATTAACR